MGGSKDPLPNLAPPCFLSLGLTFCRLLGFSWVLSMILMATWKWKKEGRAGVGRRSKYHRPLGWARSPNSDHHGMQVLCPLTESPQPGPFLVDGGSGPQDLCTCCSHHVQCYPYFYKEISPIPQWSLDGAAPGACVRVTKTLRGPFVRAS